ncbi:catalase [Alsobacter metallidurans]|uniref:Catalase n=1 Tax=Alsobacter metallidurans TaxID=340221 RepID=A0A917I6K5_9HYPH|nr:catalase family protein [Alsobacter metallidurans]GGH16844.1 catalase [Alsobacter metallidurans]
MSDTRSPLRFEPSFEQVDAEKEARVAAEIAETMVGISRKTFKDGGHGLRSVHAKSHALVRGRIEILGGLPAPYAQWLFSKPGSYPVVMRFSSIPGDILPDSISTPRGLSLKILGAPGPRLPGATGDDQDFVLVNGPAFKAPTPEAFLSSLKLLAATTDRVEPLKRAVAAVAGGAERVLEAFGGESALLKTMGGEPQTNPAGETYHSQTPLLWGDYIAKVSAAPASPNLQALSGKPVDIGDDKDGLRSAMLALFAREGGTWELRAQLCTDLEAMPIEDASVVWPEGESAHVAVARITVEPQESWSPALAREIDDGMAFSPWHGLAAHRPLGAVNRARRVAYPRSAAFRFEKNSVDPAMTGDAPA